MKNLNEYTISDIEAMTEKDAAENALETMQVKGFNIYFINFKGYFGYSYLVFKNNHHIRYADDYELHHKSRAEEQGLDGLREYYIESLNRKLFTDEEICSPLKTYGEYDQKKYFLYNYYAMQEDYVSMFTIVHSPEEEAEYESKIKGLKLDPVGFCYMSDEDFIKKHISLLNKLEEQKESMSNNFEYNKEAFLYEMYNHEYGINWQGDYDVLSCFGNINYRGDSTGELQSYFRQLGFTEVQKKAYIAARNEYYQKEVA